MARTIEYKTQRRLQAAVKEWRSGKYKFVARCAAAWNVSSTTLARRLNIRARTPNKPKVAMPKDATPRDITPRDAAVRSPVSRSSRSHKALIPPATEEIIVTILLDQHKKGLRVGPTQVKQIAQSVAELPTLPSQLWYHKFRKRHKTRLAALSELPPRKPVLLRLPVSQQTIRSQSTTQQMIKLQKKQQTFQIRTAPQVKSQPTPRPPPQTTQLLVSDQTIQPQPQEQKLDPSAEAMDFASKPWQALGPAESKHRFDVMVAEIKRLRARVQEVEEALAREHRFNHRMDFFSSDEENDDEVLGDIYP